LRAAAASRLGSKAEARWLAEAVTGERWPAGSASEPARHRFDALVARRVGGEPLQYVIGQWGFRTLDLVVDRRVLIPRPETEQVVEAAVAELDRMAADPVGQRDGETPERQIAVDLGTGSGAIALALAAERDRVEVWATDVSEPALAVAAANLGRLAHLRGLGRGVSERVHLARGSWWTAHLDAEVVEWEPRLALEAGPTGLEAVAEILGAAREWLRPMGVAVIEIAPDQSAAVRTLARSAGFGSAEIELDLTGRDRILVARGTP
jgi:release factor glutamine methyltransferase